MMKLFGYPNVMDSNISIEVVLMANLLTKLQEENGK